jgi:hypothetical protein
LNFLLLLEAYVHGFSCYARRADRQPILLLLDRMFLLILCDVALEYLFYRVATKPVCSNEVQFYRQYDNGIVPPSTQLLTQRNTDQEGIII